MPKKQAHRRDGIYERKDRPGYWGSWIGANGRRVQRKLNAPTLTQAKQMLADEKAKADKQRVLGYAAPTKDTFAVFATEFLGYQERRIAPRPTKGKLSQTEYSRQRGIVEHYLTPFFGRMKLAMIRRKDVAAYVDSRMGKVSDGTIIKEVNVLKRLFTIAVEKELVPANPAHKAPVPQAPEGRVRYLQPKELGQVLHACPAWLQPIVGLAVSTGMRRGELLKIRWEDIDLPNGQIILKHTKNGRTRPAYLNDLAVQVIAALGAGAHAKRGLLFPDVTPAQVTVAFIRACEAAGIKDFSMHDLRHTFASHARMNGVDLHSLQKLLGHSDSRMTNRYAHLSDEFLGNAVRRLDGVLTLTPEVETNGTDEPAR
jgi:integrase